MQILVGRQNTMRAERRYGFHLLENEPLENERHPQCQISIQVDDGEYNDFRSPCSKIIFGARSSVG
jgi:hypothetical protein